MQPILAESAPHRRTVAFAFVLALFGAFLVVPDGPSGQHHHRYQKQRIGKCVRGKYVPIKYARDDAAPRAHQH